MADTKIIPAIDLGPYLARTPGTIDRTAGEFRFALTEIGFHFIVNHGVPSGQIRDVLRQVARFYARSLEKKLETKLDKHNVGYLPMQSDTLRTSTVETVTKPNLNEALFVARDLRAIMRTCWPIGASAAPTAGRPTCRASGRSSSTIATRWSSWRRSSCASTRFCEACSVPWADSKPAYARNEGRGEPKADSG